MDKIYPLLPWLTVDQAVHWIRLLTSSPINSTDLISLCDAGQCFMYIDVGVSRSGTDDDTWLIDVFGSGYQCVLNPKVLIPNITSEPVLIEVLGEASWTMDGSSRTEEIKWFFTLDRTDVFPIFKSPSIRALAEKINADELADTERELQSLRKHSEQQRTGKEAALLRANEAEAEIGELRHELVLATDRADVYRRIAIDMRGTEDELVRQLKHEHENGASAGPKPADPRKMISIEDSNTVSKRERGTYERLIYVLADEAGYRMNQPYADEALILAYADKLGVKGLAGKGVIAKRLKSARARFAQDQLG